MADREYVLRLSEIPALWDDLIPDRESDAFTPRWRIVVTSGGERVVTSRVRIAVSCIAAVLSGGLLGEREGDDVGRSETTLRAFAEQLSHPAGNDLRFPGARAGDELQVPRRVVDGVELGRGKLHRGTIPAPACAVIRHGRPLRSFALSRRDRPALTAAACEVWSCARSSTRSGRAARNAGGAAPAGHRQRHRVRVLPRRVLRSTIPATQAFSLLHPRLPAVFSRRQCETGLLITEEGFKGAVMRPGATQPSRPRGLYRPLGRSPFFFCPDDPARERRAAEDLRSV